MNRPPMKRMLTAVAVAVIATACGGGDGAQPVSQDAAADVASEDSSSTDRTAQNVPDACTFLSREEISAAIGRELRDGEPQSTLGEESECRFDTAPGLEVSTTYPNPVIPEMELGSVTINTHSSTPKDFNAFRESLGSEAESVTGVGDDACFWGSDVIYVRVAKRGFSVRISADGTDDQMLRAALLRLAKAGASNL